MKKFAIMIILVGLGLIVLLDQNPVWLYGLAPGMASQAEIERVEFFKQLSKTYYGSEQYWEELSLVNKAWSDRNDSELIVPSIEAISRLKNRQNVTLVDNYHQLQAEPPEYDERIVNNKSSFEFVYYFIALSSLFISFVRYRRKKES